MTFVVTDACQGCRYTECVSVCPVECFHVDEEMTYIDPDTCIDCAGCVPACPVNAIYDEVSLPDEFSHWKEINRERSQKLPVLSEQLEPLPGAEQKKRELGL